MSEEQPEREKRPSPEPEKQPSIRERILWELEEQRAELLDIANGVQRIAEAIEHYQAEASLVNESKEPEPLSDQLNPIETLQTHMESHGVNTKKVDMAIETETNEKAEKIGQYLWFDNVYEEMTDEENNEFRDYTMNQDHVEVDEWVEYGVDDDGEPLNRPDGYVVDLEDVEGLV